MPEPNDKPQSEPPPAAALNLVMDALQRLRYGAIQLTIHEGRLVQVDVTERSRFPA